MTHTIIVSNVGSSMIDKYLLLNVLLISTRDCEVGARLFHHGLLEFLFGLFAYRSSGVISLVTNELH